MWKLGLKKTRGNLHVAFALGFLGIASAYAADVPEQALRFYSDGALISADALESSGPGFIRIFPQNGRGFTSRDMHDTIEGAAFTIADRYPGLDRIQLGDFSQQNGGKISGHVSHQNGLDADISYFRMNHREQNVGDGTDFDEPFVQNGKITANFDTERNWELIRSMVSIGKVTRIFMDPVIKTALCQYAASRSDSSTLPEFTETLRVLRPFTGHQAHMHVRITCPSTSPRCLPQDPPPVGDGCSELSQGEASLHILDWLILKKIENEIPE